MIKNYVYGGALTLLFMGVVLVPSAQAETTTTGASVVDQIKALMTKLEDLQKQLATLRGEIKTVIRAGVTEGMTGDDIEEVQKLLATDPTIYPEGKVTGYYGNLTKEAIKRLQKRHELEVTGIIDEATHDLLESYLKERFGEDIPPGLLRAPGIAKKVEIRIKEDCDNSGKGKALFCEKLKIKYKNDDNSDDDSDDDSEEFEVEIETEDSGDTMTFKFAGTEYSLELDSLIYGDILRVVADELDTTVAKLDADFKYEIKKELLKELSDDEDDEDDDSDDDSDDDDDSDEDDEDEDD